MNLPNKLTILRIILAFVCIGFILHNSLFSLITALILFGLASITDFFDGYIARKKNLISDLGKILDPIADKVLIIGVFCAFLGLGIINSWIVILIMFREFTITGLRLYSLSKGIVLEAKKIGKHKTVSQVVGIFIIFFAIILSKIIPESVIVPFLYKKLIPLLMGYIAAITVFSGVYYFWVNRKAIRTF